jgi:hypothetical protein
MRGISNLLGAYTRTRPLNLRDCASLNVRIFQSSLSQAAAAPSSKMETVDTTSRLEHLRGLMKKANVDVYGDSPTHVVFRRYPS